MPVFILNMSIIFLLWLYFGKTRKIFVNESYCKKNILFNIEFNIKIGTIYKNEKVYIVLKYHISK